MSPLQTMIDLEDRLRERADAARLLASPTRTTRNERAALRERLTKMRHTVPASVNSGGVLATHAWLEARKLAARMARGAWGRGPALRAAILLMQQYGA